jgi:hypothetical protein
MGYKLQLAGLALATALLTVTGAQTPDRQSTHNLEFRLQPLRMEEGVPQAFDFRLVNKTDHDVRVPIPTVDCEDSFSGDILMRIHFTPLKPEPSDEGQGCAHDREQWPPIMDRITDWKIVHPGDALTLTADHEHLFYDGGRPGTYEFWAIYSPPSIDPSERKTLQESGIDFPHEKLRTYHLTFLKKE